MAKPANAAFIILLLCATVSPSAAEERAWQVLTPRTASEHDGKRVEGMTPQILTDASVLTVLPAPRASEVTLHFQLDSATSFRRIRVELLPDSRYRDGRLGRNPERKKLMLFDIEARIAGNDGVFRRTEWQSCEVSVDANDSQNTNGGNLIDNASDSGWSIPTRADARDRPCAVLVLRDALHLPADGRFSISFDVGGHPDFDTPARYRVSVTNE